MQVCESGSNYLSCIELSEGVCNIKVCILCVYVCVSVCVCVCVFERER